MHKLEDTILTKAHAAVYGDREESYGPPGPSIETTKDLWNTYLQRCAAIRGETASQLTTEDVCQMMILLKMSRLIANPTHEDSLVDQAGWAAVQERVIKND